MTKKRANNQERVDYHEYIRSSQWARTRKRFYKSKLWARQGKCCYVCRGRERMDLHHKTYKTLGRENLNHLVALCRRCHELVHKIKPTGPAWGTARRLRKLSKRMEYDWTKIEKRVEVLGVKAVEKQNQKDEKRKQRGQAKRDRLETLRTMPSSEYVTIDTKHFLKTGEYRKMTMF